MKYEIPKSVISRKPIVTYACPSCSCQLKSSLTEAGKTDTCPDCGTSFVVPGEMDKRRMELAEDRSQRDKEEQERIEEEKKRNRLEIQRNKDRLTKQKHDSIIMTTTNNIDGFVVAKYICIESVEIVLGTSLFSEISGTLSDIFGTRSSVFESKMQKAKQAAFDTLRDRAVACNADAVIGIDVDYTTYTRDLIGLVVNGTCVKLDDNSSASIRPAARRPGPET